MAVLSLLGPATGRPAGHRGPRLRCAACRSDGGGTARRRLPAPAARPGHRTGPGGAAASPSPNTPGGSPRPGVRPAGVWAYEAHRVAALAPAAWGRHRRAHDSARGRLDRRPGVGAVHLDKGCYRGQETVARVHNLGKPPRMLVVLQLDGSSDRPVTGDPVTRRRAHRRPDRHRSSSTSTRARSRWRCSSGAYRSDTELVAGAEAQAPAVIDPDSMPEADATAGAGRAAVDRLRGALRPWNCARARKLTRSPTTDDRLCADSAIQVTVVLLCNGTTAGTPPSP